MLIIWRNINNLDESESPPSPGESICILYARETWNPEGLEIGYEPADVREVSADEQS